MLVGSPPSELASMQHSLPENHHRPPLRGTQQCQPTWTGSPVVQAGPLGAHSGLVRCDQGIAMAAVSHSLTGSLGAAVPVLTKTAPLSTTLTTLQGSPSQTSSSSICSSRIPYLWLLPAVRRSLLGLLLLVPVESFFISYEFGRIHRHNISNGASGSQCIAGEQWTCSCYYVRHVPGPDLGFRHIKNICAGRNAEGLHVG